MAGIDASVPTIPILLLGDAGVGKSTFLSYVSSPPATLSFTTDSSFKAG